MAGLVPAIFITQQSILMCRHPGEGRDLALLTSCSELTSAMHDAKHPAVYIMASRYRGTLYVGVTSKLWSRVCDHKNGTTPGYTSKYDVTALVWYEHRHSMASAIRREKQIKEWQRAWKIRLVEETNPEWRDLHDEIDVLATLVQD